MYVLKIWGPALGLAFSFINGVLEVQNVCIFTSTNLSLITCVLGAVLRPSNLRPPLYQKGKLRPPKAKDTLEGKSVFTCRIWARRHLCPALTAIREEVG